MALIGGRPARLVLVFGSSSRIRRLFVSSVAVFTGGVVGPHYAASKAGPHGLVYWLAARYADQGVTVNAIAPALIEGTAMPAQPIDAACILVGSSPH